MKKIITVLFLLLPLVATAAIREHTFTILGDHGETGNGSFTWDDAVVPDGTLLSGPAVVSPNVLSISITISGGNVVGDGTFSLSDCTEAFLDATPDFAIWLTFDCDNGTYRISDAAPHRFGLHPTG